MSTPRDGPKTETRYMLWILETGDGCGYMVGCGQRLVRLKAQTAHEAWDEAVAQLMEHGMLGDGQSRTCAKALLIEASHVEHLPIVDIQNDIEAQRKQRDIDKRIAKFIAEAKALGLTLVKAEPK